MRLLLVALAVALAGCEATAPSADIPFTAANGTGGVLHLSSNTVSSGS